MLPFAAFLATGENAVSCVGTMGVSRRFEGCLFRGLRQPPTHRGEQPAVEQSLAWSNARGSHTLSGSKSSRRDPDPGLGPRVRALSVALTRPARIAPVPYTHAQNDHFSRVVAPFERIVQVDRHGILYPIRMPAPKFATEPPGSRGAVIIAALGKQVFEARPRSARRE